MALTEIDPIDGALDLLRRGELHAAHILLADAYDKNTTQVELMKIANLIYPCQMINEAADALNRAKWQRLVNPPNVKVRHGAKTQMHEY